MPDLVTTDRAPPAEPPISASKRLLMTRNSRDRVLAEAGAGQAEGLVGEVDAVDHDRRLAGVAGRAHHRAPVMKRKPPRSRCTPGAMKASFWKSRSATGSSSICSGTMLVEESVLNTSTMGASAVTVIVSDTSTRMVITSLAVWPTRSTRSLCS